MNPLGAIITLALCIVVIAGSRRVATIAIILGTCYVTQGQNLELGFNFTAIRLILLAGFFRTITRNELSQIFINRIDRALIIYAVCIAAISTIRVGTTDQLIYQVGGLYNIFLSYFVCRALLKDEADINGVLSALVFPLIPFALLLILEANTGRNLFAVFGGVPEISMVREGHIRAEGAFRSPITAGAFGATFAMLYGGMLFANSNTRNAAWGLVISIIILLCAHSSGPFLGLMFGVVSLLCWRVRNHTSAIRRSIVAVLVILHFFIMKAPVWFLIARVSDIVGGGGYHRALLIDQFINHFGSLWLAGTDNTSGWMPYDLAIGGSDLTNQFVSDGVNAGILGLIFSITLIVRCFQGVGIAMRTRHEIAPNAEKMIWTLGATLVASVAILFSVTYFDQMHVIWYFLLACIGSTVSEKLSPAYTS